MTCSSSTMSREMLRFLTEDQVRELRRRFGTPLYVYSQRRLVEQASKMRNLPHAFGLSIRYSIKANANSEILRLFDRLGCLFDASSAWEALRAISAGVDGEKILVTAQEASHLDELVAEGVELTACSLPQLEDYGRRFPGSWVSIRVNPGIGGGLVPRLKSGGPQSSFGIWYGSLGEAAEIGARHGLRVRRFHQHIGSGNDPAVWLEAAGRALELLEMFPDVSILNLGGGYLVPSFSSDPEVTYDEPAEHVARLLEAHARRTGCKLHLELEPGTYLMANGGSLVATINEVVSTGSQGFQFLKLDAGLTEVVRPALYGALHPLVVVPAENEERSRIQKYAVVGHCCIAGDLLTVDPQHALAVLPQPMLQAKAGDLLVVERAGGYCASMSLKNFNSFPEPPEILLTAQGEARLIRQRQTLAQMIQNEVGHKQAGLA